MKTSQVLQAGRVPQRAPGVSEGAEPAERVNCVSLLILTAATTRLLLRRGAAGGWVLCQQLGFLAGRQQLSECNAAHVPRVARALQCQGTSTISQFPQNSAWAACVTATNVEQVLQTLGPCTPAFYLLSLVTQSGFKAQVL